VAQGRGRYGPAALCQGLNAGLSRLLLLPDLPPSFFFSSPLLCPSYLPSFLLVLLPALFYKDDERDPSTASMETVSGRLFEKLHVRYVQRMDARVHR